MNNEYLQRQYADLLGAKLTKEISSLDPSELMDMVKATKCVITLLELTDYQTIAIIGALYGALFKLRLEQELRLEQGYQNNCTHGMCAYEPLPCVPGKKTCKAHS